MYTYFKIDVNCKKNNQRVNRGESPMTRWLEKQPYKNAIICVYMKNKYERTVAKALDAWENGFDFAGQHYVYLFSGAGDSRTKSWYMIVEDLHEDFMNWGMCGLTMDRINRLYENKHIISGLRFVNYLSMLGTAGEKLDFNMRRVAVIKDFEHDITYCADFVDPTGYSIERNKEITEPFNATDGGGIYRPGTFERTSFCCRSPWVKGYIAEYPWDKLPETMVDVWENEFKTEDVDLIMTESMMKTWKCYNDYNEYVEAFEAGNHEFCFCIEPHVKYMQDAAYQPIQTLMDMTDDEVAEMCSYDFNSIRRMLAEPEYAAKVLGYKLYCPEMANSRMFLNTLREYIDNKLTKMTYAKVKLHGTYYKLMPDYNLVFGHEHLEAGEVCCKDFEDGELIDCIRFPHSYGEHVVLRNRHIPELMVDGCICINAMDNSNLRLNSDNDGDSIYAVHADSVVTKVAKRQPVIGSKYELPKSQKHAVVFDRSEHGVWTELLACYGDESNIGIVANWMTKIINSDLPLEEIEELCLYLGAAQQFRVDYAKTGTPLVMHPDLQDRINKLLRTYKKPLFMKNAKATEDKARRDDHNRMVRETGNGKKQTKADSERGYDDAPNTDRVMGKLWVAVEEFRNSLGDLANFHYEGIGCLMAPVSITKWTLDALRDAEKKANNKYDYDYKNRVCMNNIDNNPEGIEHLEGFSFNDLLDVALNDRSGDIAMAAIMILWRSEFAEYCRSNDKIVVSGTKWTKTAGQQLGGEIMKKSVRVINANTGMIYEFDSLTECADVFGMKKSNISKYLNDGKQHKIKKIGAKCEFKCE